MALTPGLNPPGFPGSFARALCGPVPPPGVVKFAQVVGVFPGPRFDDAEGEAGEADVELLGWEEPPGMGGKMKIAGKNRRI